MIKCLLKAFQIGVIAGIRTMTAPALVSYKLAHTKLNRSAGPTLQDSKLHFLTSKTTTNVLAVMAVGELIADKLPGAPDRTGQPQVWGRIGSGALSASALTGADGNSAPIGAVVGALGAVAGSVAFYQLRRWLTHEKDLPDLWVALAEDALTIGAGWLVVHQD
ncbi:DUF4126 family protein [Spirosoma luteum]|uniref:DUF4126 family protein n=1 Tax=Spirosoma luteum TaxID=431553 RepID=UPI00037E6ADB|nr:DUF4126 family protein [Spirosoma luteum]